MPNDGNISAVDDDSDIEEEDLADGSDMEEGVVAAAATAADLSLSDDDDGTSNTGSDEDVDGWSPTFSMAGLPEQFDADHEPFIICHQKLPLPNSFNCSFRTVCGRCWSQKQEGMHMARMFCKAMTFQ